MGTPTNDADTTDAVEDKEVDSKKKADPVQKQDTDYKIRDPKDPLHYVRLIDLSDLSSTTDDPDQLKTAENDELLDISDEAPDETDPKKDSRRKSTQFSGLYVTLSHCWGGATFTKLMRNTLEQFKQRIPLNDLPRTFREVMHFVRRLNPEIRYIWIDSLCIIQGDHDDWAAEAAKMYDVYRNSYCNISATAARNSHEGLYFPRNPHQLWGDEVNINTDGIPRARNKQERNQGLGHQPVIRRCDVLDLSFWEREVDKAPVNTRAWVLQERLLPPRVLHFCQNQIAWECRYMDAAERFPHGVPKIDHQIGDIDYMPKIKTLIPNPYGRNPISTIPNEISNAAHQNWKTIVERYSKTGLTKPGDKLIALAGIAEMMDSQIQGRYIAGMWEKYLASELLWRVEPVWKNGVFSFPSSRPKGYRAPGFSWAAIDARQGVKCADTVKESEMHISVKSVVVNNEDKSPFGEVEKTDIELRVTGRLKRIILEKRGKDRRFFKRLEEEDINTRYFWTGFPDEQNPLDFKIRKDDKLQDLLEHDAVYLDSPSDDLGTIETQGNQLYCMPALTDPKSSDSLTCLLLVQLKADVDLEVRRFHRVGLTVVSSYESGRDAIFFSGFEEEEKEGKPEERPGVCTGTHVDEDGVNSPCTCSCQDGLVERKEELEKPKYKKKTERIFETIILV